MSSSPDWQKVASKIEQSTQIPFAIESVTPVSGGCINSAFIIQSKTHSYFIKLNQAKRLPMFKAEFDGLKEIAQTKTIKVPNPILYGVTNSDAFLTLENIPLMSSNHQTDQQLGTHLANLHSIKQSQFGWHQDNTIGSTQQINNFSNDWVHFWQVNRLGFQIALASNNGYAPSLIDSAEKLSDLVSCFFTTYTPQPSLLHGDLWAGNAGVTKQNQAIVYDPACYYGDREADIAMTELFGGFSTHFYSAYNEAFPLDSGYKVRKNLYNLYHILNHLNLFGRSYQRQAQDIINSLLAEV